MALLRCDTNGIGASGQRGQGPSLGGGEGSALGEPRAPWTPIGRVAGPQSELLHFDAGKPPVVVEAEASRNTDT
jgi:hypothetical protein